jgi:hypothetical protein
VKDHNPVRFWHLEVCELASCACTRIGSCFQALPCYSNHGKQRMLHHGSMVHRGLHWPAFAQVAIRKQNCLCSRRKSVLAILNGSRDTYDFSLFLTRCRTCPGWCTSGNRLGYGLGVLIVFSSWTVNRSIALAGMPAPGHTQMLLWRLSLKSSSGRRKS